MKNFPLLASALTLTLSLAPMAHADETGSARLELKTPVAKSDVIIDGAVWYCEDKVCTTSSAPDLPATFVCAHVARVIGAVESFTVGDKSLTTAQLAACNAKAKG